MNGRQKVCNRFYETDCLVIEIERLRNEEGKLLVDFVAHVAGQAKIETLLQSSGFGDEKPQYLNRAPRWTVFEGAIQAGKHHHSFDLWDKIDSFDIPVRGDSSKRKRLDMQTADVRVYVHIADAYETAERRVTREMPGNASKSRKVTPVPPEPLKSAEPLKKHETLAEKPAEKPAKPAEPAQKPDKHAEPAEKPAKHEAPAQEDVEMRDVASPSEATSDLSPVEEGPKKPAKRGSVVRKSTMVDLTPPESIPPLPETFPFNLTFKQFLEIRGRDDVDNKMKWCRARALYYRRARVTYMDGKQEEGWILFVNYFGHPSSMDDGMFLDEEGIQLIRPPTVPVTAWPTRKSSIHDELFQIGNADSDKFFSEPNSAYGLGSKKALDAVLAHPKPWIRTTGVKVYGVDRVRGVLDDEDDSPRFEKVEFWVEDGDKPGAWKTK